MCEKLKLHIKKLQNSASLSLIAILLTIISIGFGILFLFIPSLFAIIFFATATVCIVYLIHSSRTAKKEAKEAIYKPVIFDADKNLTFEEIESNIDHCDCSGVGIFGFRGVGTEAPHGDVLQR